MGVLLYCGFRRWDAGNDYTEWIKMIQGRKQRGLKWREVDASAMEVIALLECPRWQDAEKAALGRQAGPIPARQPRQRGATVTLLCRSHSRPDPEGLDVASRDRYGGSLDR